MKQWRKKEVETLLVEGGDKLKIMEALKSFTIYYDGIPIFREVGYTKYHAMDKAFTSLSAKYEGIDRKKIKTRKK